MFWGMIDTGAVVTSTRSRVGAGDNKERGLRASHGDAAEEEEEDPPLVVADINLGNGVSGAIPVRASDDTTVLAERFIRSHDMNPDAVLSDGSTLLATLAAQLGEVASWPWVACRVQALVSAARVPCLHFISSSVPACIPPHPRSRLPPCDSACHNHRVDVSSAVAVQRRRSVTPPRLHSS